MQNVNFRANPGSYAAATHTIAVLMNMLLRQNYVSVLKGKLVSDRNVAVYIASNCLRFRTFWKAAFMNNYDLEYHPYREEETHNACRAFKAVTNCRKQKPCRPATFKIYPKVYHSNVIPFSLNS